MGSNCTVKFSKGTWHHRQNRERMSFKSVNPMSGIRVLPDLKEEHKTKPCNKKDARRVAWDSAKKFTSSRMRIKTRFCSPTEVWVMPTPSSKKPEEREFVVDSGDSMHMLSKKVLSSEELENLRRSRIATRVVTANGEVQTNEEAQVYVHDFHHFVTMQLLEDTPAVLSLGKICEEHGNTNAWTSSQKPHLTKQRKRILCETKHFVHPVVPGLSTNSGTSSSSTSLPQDSSSTSSSPATERSDDGTPRNWRDPQKRHKFKRGATMEHWETDCETSEEFTENLKDTEVPAPAHISHDSDSERPKKWHPGSAVFLLTSRKIEIAKYACEPRWQGLLAEDALAKQYTEQKNGDLITADHNGGYGQLGSANKWGSTSVCSRFWSLRNNAITRRHACSSVTWKNTEIPMRGPAVKSHIWPNNGRGSPLRDETFRTPCCPGFVDKFWYQLVFYIASAGLIKHIFKSSNRAKWRWNTKKLARSAKTT